MNNRYNYLTINLRKDLSHKNIEEKLISLKPESGNLNNKQSIFKDKMEKNKALYYSNVIKRQNTHSPDHSILLHQFVDDKKVTYKDITNKIDINELSSKVKNIIINTQRFKSNFDIKPNDNQPLIYHKKTKSSFSNRYTNSSFTTENQSTISLSVKNIFVNKNNTMKNKQNKDTFLLNLNLNNYLNNKNNKENKTYNNNKYYCETLREYLNEQINTIKSKRNKINESNVSMNNKDIDHNYSIDNENKDSLIKNKNENINNIDEVFILSDYNNKDILKNNGKKHLLNTKKTFICQIKSKNLDEKLNFGKTHKLSNYLSFKQNKITSKNKNNKTSNTFRNTHISKNNTMKNLNNNVINNNMAAKKTPCNINKLNKYNKYILPKPVIVNTTINKNINKNNTNKIYKCFSMANLDNNDNLTINNENINTANIYNSNNKMKNNQKAKNKNKKSNNINKSLKNNSMNKKNYIINKNIMHHKKRKNYSEIIRNKMHSTTQKKIKVSITNKN